MENISTEEVITSLFILGFDKVDPLLFTYTLANIPKSGSEVSFRVIDKELSPDFKK